METSVCLQQLYSKIYIYSRESAEPHKNFIYPDKINESHALVDIKLLVNHFIYYLQQSTPSCNH